MPADERERRVTCGEPSIEGAAAIAVRQGEPADHLALLGIDALAASRFERAAAIRDALARGECLVAEARGQAVGYVVLDYSFFGFGFIAVIVVAPGQRRRGIGIRLLAEAQARCTSRKLFASANASNRAAHALFARAGFSRSGLVENLDEGDPEIFYFRPCRGPAGPGDSRSA